MDEMDDGSAVGSVSEVSGVGVAGSGVGLGISEGIVSGVGATGWGVELLGG